MKLPGATVVPGVVDVVEGADVVVPVSDNCCH